MARIHVFDSHVETASGWLKELIANLELRQHDQTRALHALRAGLHAIRDRLPTNEVVDLGAQLPTLIRGYYYEGWKQQRDGKPARNRAAMIADVQKQLTPDRRLDPVDVLRAVIQLLVTHVSDGELRDVLAILPKPIAALWHDLTGHALTAPPITALERRTGYSR